MTLLRRLFVWLGFRRAGALSMPRARRNTPSFSIPCSINLPGEIVGRVAEGQMEVTGFVLETAIDGEQFIPFCDWPEAERKHLPVTAATELAKRDKETRLERRISAQETKKDFGKL